MFPSIGPLGASGQMLSKYLYGMNLCVMSRNESPESIASAPKTSGLREATFQAPKPPDEKPNTPRLRALGIVRYAASTVGMTSCRRYCSKLPVTGESTHWPQPQR